MPLTTSAGGVGGLSGNTQPQSTPTQQTQQQQQQQQPTQQQPSAPAPAKPVAGNQKGVASGGAVPTDNETNLDPFEQANRATAIAVAERKKREELEAKLLGYERAQKEQADAAAAAKKAADEKAADIEKQQFAERKKKMLAIINQAMEQLEKDSGGLVTKNDTAAAAAPLVGMTNDAQTADQLTRVKDSLGPVIELAMKACSGARAQEERNKQRELAANMQTLNAMLATPPQSGFSISGNANFGMQPMPTMPMASAPVNAGQPAETTTFKASLNAFDNFQASANGVGQFYRAPLGAPGVASSTPAKDEKPVSQEPLDFSKPGWGMRLVEEFSSHTPGWCPSEKYLLHGGVEVVQKIVNANGQQHIQSIPQMRRAIPMKARLSMKDLDPEGFEQIREGINAGLKPGGRPALKDYLHMRVDEDFRKVLVPYKPEPTDEGVTML